MGNFRYVFRGSYQHLFSVLDTMREKEKNKHKEKTRARTTRPRSFVAQKAL